MATRILHARAGSEPFVARVSGHAVEVQRGEEAPAATFDTHYLGHGRVVLRANGSARIAWVVEDGDTRWVHCDGEVAVVEITEGAPRRTRSLAEGPPTLCAPMPATVIRVVAPAGTPVRRGATVVLLEAMKMELPLRATRDGHVKAVHCREGELVQAGVVLVELEGAGP